MKSMPPTKYHKARASLAIKYLDGSLKKEIHESITGTLWCHCFVWWGFLPKIGERFTKKLINTQDKMHFWLCEQDKIECLKNPRKAREARS